MPFWNQFKIINERLGTALTIKEQKEDLFNILLQNDALASLCEQSSNNGICVNLNAVNCKFCPISGEKNLKSALGMDINI